MDERRSQKHYRNCPVVYALDILSKKWLIPIICELDHCETMRYTELAKVIPGITGMMLTSALKTLQNLGLVTRTQYNEVPLRVEYSLTKAGKSIMPSLFQLSSWSVDMMVDEGIEVTCPRNSCLAQVAQNVAANEENILRYRRSWDEEFDLLYREILENPQTASADPIEKLHLLVRGLLKAATSYGEQLSRMATIYYIIGEENSSDLLASDRAVCRIMDALLDEAREQGILKEGLANEEIRYACMSFAHGLNSYWELERGAFPIVEKNTNILAWFFDSLRK